MGSENGGAPFREPDLEARLRSLREEEWRLRARVGTLGSELARLDRWSLGRFLLGAILLPSALVLLIVALVLTRGC
jgi:hypothetical protein